ncbi:MAG: class I SAM-dependent methyltransferase, partial [Thermoplasmata archaeon]
MRNLRAGNAVIPEQTEKDLFSGEIADTSQVQEYYGRKEIAESYEDMRFSSFFGWATHTMEVEIVNSLLQRSHPRRLLEIAIGPARLTKDLLFFDRGVGIDTAEKMLNMAQRVLHQDRWNLVRATVTHMPFEEHSFDAVVVFRLLEHFKLDDRRKAYLEIRHLLKPGGLLILNVNNAGGVGRLLKRHLLPVKHFLDHASVKISRKRILDRRSRARVFSKLYTADEIQ